MIAKILLAATLAASTASGAATGATIAARETVIVATWHCGPPRDIGGGQTVRTCEWIVK